MAKQDQKGRNQFNQYLLSLIHFPISFNTHHLGVPSKKKNSIFTDIIQIEVDPLPSHPIFDKFIFDTVLIMLTSLPPIEFLTKILKF